MTFPNSTSEEPLRLAIAADARLCSPDYTNDQIWELNTREGEPRTLSLQTTFGLRARGMRLFPSFIRKDQRVQDPLQFARPPRLLAYDPNYISLTFAAFPEIEVTAEYWVPESHAVAGRLSLKCTGSAPESFRLEWIGLLSPLKGQSMDVRPVDTHHVLHGMTGDLSLVCFLTGGADPGAGPYPSLALDLTLEPGVTRCFTWALVALDSPEAAYQRAWEITSLPWEAEIARLELLNAGQLVEIHTGDPAWDTAFDLSQKLARGLFFPGGSHLPDPSFVLSRRPDQGYSMRGDGSEYPYLWSGQSPLEALYLSSLLLPGNVDLCAGVLRNFLATQTQDGSVDWKPGLGGQRSRRLAQPVLASLALQIDEYQDNSDWLAEIYPALLRFLQHWFEADHDRDQDSIPEWDHPFQTGLEDAPIYDRWHAQAQGVDIATLESPALAAFLYRECKSMIRIARRIQTKEGQAWLEFKAEALRCEVESTWDKKASNYRYRDYRTHEHSSGSVVHRFSKSGKSSLRRSFRTPHRLQLRLQCQGENSRPVTVTIVGETEQGEIVESFPASRFFWIDGSGHATSEALYRKLNRVEVRGLVEGDTGTIASIDYTQEDLSLLLPLWAGIPDKKRAKALVENTLLKRFLQKFGVSLSPSGSDGGRCPDCVYLPWNQLLGEALLLYGYNDAAANLVTRLMNAILPILKHDGVFRAWFHASDGAPGGESNALPGLPPTGLFLQALGIRRLRKNEVILQGFNPFPWPVTVKYQGMIITRHATDTVVNFSTGQTITVDGAGPHRVSLSE